MAGWEEGATEADEDGARLADPEASEVDPVVVGGSAPTGPVPRRSGALAVNQASCSSEKGGAGHDQK